MIRVALISHSPYFAGAEKMLFSLGCILKECDEYYPIIYLPQNIEVNSFAKACKENNLSTFAIPALQYYIWQEKSNASQVANNTIEQANLLSEIFSEHGINLVVCNTMTSLVPALAAKKANIPMVLWVHGILDGFYIPAKYDLEQRLMYDRILMHLSDEVVCCSEWTENYYSRLSTKPISTICNWSAEPDEILDINFNSKFVCLNTFDKHKGVSILLEAVKILKNNSYVFTLDLYGTGVEEHVLKNFVKKHKLEEFVRFCGRTNDVGKVFNDCFCLMQPCFLEPFGLTITEAMSHSRPVIAVASGGPKQIVDNEQTGFLVPPRDAEALAEKMAYLLDNPDVAKKMGESGRKRYEELFSPERAKQEFITLFKRVLNRQRNRNNSEQLFEDMVWGYLSMQTFVSVSSKTESQICFDNSEITMEGQLCFSGEIKKNRSYMVSCNEQTISAVGLLFACHDSAKPSGKLTVSLHQNNKQIGIGEILLDNIVSDAWTLIDISDCRCQTGNIIVNLSFTYNNGSGKLGVYEDSAKRTFIYKVFNKIGMHLKGNDVLVIKLNQ